MKGTEKQIAWAEQIKERMINYCTKKIKDKNFEIEYYRNEGNLNRIESLEKEVKAWHKAIDNINLMDDAKWFINLKDSYTSQVKLNDWVEKEVAKM